ncbi:MAG: beta-ketoacyl synthase [Crocinitomicaceae bacterium]|nr:beta-ketoacyl synthase [Crocinitomicaceae bacterium]
MRKVYLKYGTLISPIGDGIQSHLEAFKSNSTGLKKVHAIGFNKENLPLGKLNVSATNTFHYLFNKACEQLKFEHSNERLNSAKTCFIISSTKADLSQLPADTFEPLRTILREHFPSANEPVIISNACISGVVAINLGAQYIQFENYDDCFVIGIDALSDFVIYGFQSLFAFSDELCQPFDKNRKGINLGEACGTIHLTAQKDTAFCVEYVCGKTSNDANHISGPSRTGEGLFRAVTKALHQAAITATDIDFISAHGTGTLFNDDMESIAFKRLGMQEIPINSMKGYFGHTLGAAGVIETLICMLSMEHSMLFKSLGFEEQGTPESLNIVTENYVKKCKYVLKTASGFGGGNAVLILKTVQ